MTNAQILAYVREILHDTITPYRHSDSKLLAILTAAVAAAKRLRPDLFLATVQQTLPVYGGPESLAVEPPIDPAYHPALGDYVIAVVQASEDEAAHLERVAAFMGQFAVLLRGGTP